MSCDHLFYVVLSTIQICNMMNASADEYFIFQVIIILICYFLYFA